MKKESRNGLILITLFAIAMAFPEATDMIYIRKIYFPVGINFPLQGFIDPHFIAIEWVRQLCTLIMLSAVGILATKKFYGRLAYFLYAFGVWDIFYYLWLKLIIGWPVSLFDWDLLFLIPWPWFGPVITPVLFAVLFIVFALIVIKFTDNGVVIKMAWKELGLFLLGMALVLYTWLLDFGKLLFAGGFVKDFFTQAKNQNFSNVIASYIPPQYAWGIFVVGLLLTVFGLILFYRRNSCSKF